MMDDHHTQIPEKILSMTTLKSLRRYHRCCQDRRIIIAVDFLRPELQNREPTRLAERDPSKSTSPNDCYLQISWADISLESTNMSKPVAQSVLVLKRQNSIERYETPNRALSLRKIWAIATASMLFDLCREFDSSNHLGSGKRQLRASWRRKAQRVGVSSRLNQ